MPRVTDIQAQKNGRFYSVFVDGKYAFSLGDLELSASSLRIGASLADSEVADWKNSSGISKLRNRALNYLSIRPRSELEVTQYLVRKDADPDQIQLAVRWLKGHGYLNDADFARRWVEHRRQGSHRSDARIRSELKQKGIDADTVDLSLKLGESEYNQESALKDLIAKRRHRYADEQKLIAYLARQGYGWSQIKEALKAED